MADTDVDNTARGRLGEAAREGLSAVTQVAGKAADVALSAVRGGGRAGQDVTDAGTRAVSSAARGGLEVVQQTAGTVGDLQREMARQSAEGSTDLGRLLADLLEEQFQHNLRVAMTLGRAVNWDEIVQAQSELMRASFERISRLYDRYLELVRTLMVTASKPPGTDRGSDLIRQPPS